MSIRLTIRWTITLALAVLIATVTIAPGTPLPGDNLFSWLYAGRPPAAQKVLHIILYAVLAFLWMWTLAHITSWRLRIAASLILTIGLGVVLEWSQVLVPGRFGTLVDIVLNAVGAVIGVVIGSVLLRVRLSRQ